MDGHRFDNITRLVSSRLSRRAGLGLLAAGMIGGPSASEAGNKKNKGKKKEKITICHQGQTRKVKKKGWQRNFPGATQGPCEVSSDVCAACPSTCFATDLRPSQDPPGYACCPAELTCTSQSSLPDQCCYPGETCDPTLYSRSLGTSFGAADTNCCRPCPGPKAFNGCCINSSEECINGDCEPSGTARLPRKRRP